MCELRRCHYEVARLSTTVSERSYCSRTCAAAGASRANAEAARSDAGIHRSGLGSADDCGLWIDISLTERASHSGATVT